MVSFAYFSIEEALTWRTRLDGHLLLTRHSGAGIQQSGLLLNKGADVNARDARGNTPLSMAICRWHRDAVMVLLENGATQGSLEAKDVYGRSVLTIVSEAGAADKVWLLLDQGADIESRDNMGRTALAYATRGNHVGVVRLLISRGAKTQPRDHYGMCPLMIAVANRFAELVRLFVNLHPDLDVAMAEKFGCNLFWWAKASGNAEIERELRRRAELSRVAVILAPDDAYIPRATKEPTWILCDVCTLRIPALGRRYVCSVCNHGDFDICEQCHSLGGDLLWKP